MTPSSFDYKSLAADLTKLHTELQAGRGEADIQHMRKIERWGRICTGLGLATAWILPNPISAFLISQGTFTRWTMMAHHVLHRGYDRVPEMPERYTSKGFASGWRRFVDWFDWIHPEAWNHEHNTLHHYYLGEAEKEVGEPHDPDYVEPVVEFVRQLPLAKVLKYMFVVISACTWKFAYYPCTTFRELNIARARREKRPLPEGNRLSWQMWSPFDPKGRELWLRSLLPYFGWNFIALPLLFLPIGAWAAINVLINMVLAEIITNVHSFIVIVTNHAGDDLYAFDSHISGKDEFYFRQIVGSTNYPTGNDGVNFMHGWLNFQIEHHLWPDMTMLQYVKAQPRVKEICEKHGVPYVQQSVWARLKKTVDIMVGNTTTPHWQPATVPVTAM